MSAEPSSDESGVLWHDRPYLLAGLLFLVSFLVRLVVIAAYPDPWQFDAYQRWAGRDHLWVQVWLPATQVVVWTVAKLGGGILALRLVMATIASATVAMGGMLAHRLGGIRGAWAYWPMALFGPYLLWSVVPYQESTLLFALFGGLLLSHRHPRLGDLLIGALAFCRYEGWPLLVVYIVVQRRWSALLCLWGVAAYFGIDHLGLNEPFAASPDSFEDWEGLENKLTFRNTKRLFKSLWFEGARCGLQWIIIGAAFSLVRWPWKREQWVLWFAFMGQVAATIGWMYSLGVVFSRMTVLPGMVIGVISAAEIGRRWPHFSIGARRFIAVFTCGLMAWTVTFTKPDIDRMFRTMRFDVELVRVVERCPDEVWSIRPRSHPGPRRRHDGCEVLQGLTNLRAGEEFVCETWKWGGPEPTLRAVWSKKQRAYEVERLRGEVDEACGF